MMHGMFRANGGSGYVKKPEFLLNISPKNEVFDPNRTLPIRKTLKVRLYIYVDETSKVIYQSMLDVNFSICLP